MPRPTIVRAHHVQFPSHAFGTSYYSVGASSTRKNASKAVPSPLGVVVLLNIALTAASIFLLTYYVLQANRTAAQGYRVKQLNEHLLNLSEEHGALAAEQSRLEQPASLEEFARRRGMVEESDAAHIFEDGNVAKN